MHIVPPVTGYPLSFKARDRARYTVDGKMSADRETKARHENDLQAIRRLTCHGLLIPL